MDFNNNDIAALKTIIPVNKLGHAIGLTITET